LGRYRHDNFFAYQFQGEDPDGDQVEYFLGTGTLPLNLTLDPVTGWLSGHLISVGVTEQLHEFGIQVRKVVNPDIISRIYNTQMVVHGDIETSVTWLTDSDLGTINNGSVSTLSVEAVHEGTVLYYRIAENGTFNKLPQGLTLLESGNLAGRTSFKTFSLDGGTTTFNSDHATRLDVNPTTFDLTFTFTVEAYSLSGLVSVTKEFTVMVHREFQTPQNILYCKAMPPLADRNLIDSMLLNSDVIPLEHVYRADDVNFGSAKRVYYQHALGLTPATIEDYFAALSTNHFNKTVTLGELKTARALDDDGNIVYEVVYSQIIDDAVNAAGESVVSLQDISAPAIHNGTEVNAVYTNSLENMREQVVDQIGQQSKVLPRWMLSKQENGEVLGFTPAWVITYTKPEKSKLIQYNIQEFFGTQLNLIDFEIDRYTLDSRMSQNWDLVEQKWFPAVSTTFDRTAGIEFETTFDGGSLRFTSPIDLYITSDKNDTYIMFPQTKIINNEQ